MTTLPHISIGLLLASNQGGKQQSVQGAISFTLPVSFSNKVLAILFGRDQYTNELAPTVSSYSLSKITWQNRGEGGNAYANGAAWIVTIGQ